MNDWATKFLFPSDSKSVDFERFLREVDLENNDRMSRDKEKPGEIDANNNLKATFEQLSSERINDECSKNLVMLKSLEVIIQERVNSFSVFLASQSKIKTSFDVFRYTHGTLRQAFDALFVFTEQEMQQARQEANLEELKQVIMQCRIDSQKKMQEYQQQVLIAEREVSLAEKKLKKSKIALQKLIEVKDKLIYSDGKDETKPPGWKQLVIGSINNIVNHANPTASPSLEKSSKEVDKLQECVTNITNCKSNIRNEIRTLLRHISNRDQVYLANRKALQFLDRECKHIVVIALKALISREKESSSARSLVLEKFSGAVNSIDGDCDEADFIETYKSEANGIQLSSQALSIMNDIDKGMSLGQEVNNLSLERSNSGDSDQINAKDNNTFSAAGIDYEKLLGDWLDKIFYMSNENSANSVNLPPIEMIEYCKTKKISTPDDTETLEVLVLRVIEKTESQIGRNAFVISLNKFRSRQVDVTPGYYYLGAILWAMLENCMQSNDVHSAKIIMMLSQTFYRLEERKADEENSSEGEENERLLLRKYLREILIGHPLWAESRFWEHALWQLVIDQLQTIPNDLPWHEIEVAERDMAVKRVHEVIFSQVMAVIHSMLELGCSKAKTKELVYRMSVIHQLTEAQRHTLIKHIIHMEDLTN